MPFSPTAQSSQSPWASWMPCTPQSAGVLPFWPATLPVSPQTGALWPGPPDHSGSLPDACAVVQLPWGTQGVAVMNVDAQDAVASFAQIDLSVGSGNPGA